MTGPHTPECDAARSFPPTTEDDCHCGPVPAPVEPLNDDGHTADCAADRARWGWAFCSLPCLRARHLSPSLRARLETLAA